MAKTKTHTVRILNRSKQTIPLQVCPPKGDFYLHEQQVRLAPGKDAVLPKSYLRADQIKNLQAKRMIQVISDSEAIEEREAQNALNVTPGA